jgi:uncharacterized phage-associated protein
MTEPLTRAGYSVRGLANWILDYADSVGARHTNMGINKLVFFAVEAILLRHRRLLTNAKIEAWEHGPVFREVYQSFRRFGDKPITGRAAFYSTDSGEMEEAVVHLDESDATAIREALSPIIHRTASELRNLSHLPQSAWSRVWWYEGHANPGMEISPAILLGVANGGNVGEA